MAGFSECPSLKGFVHFWTLTNEIIDLLLIEPDEEYHVLLCDKNRESHLAFVTILTVGSGYVMYYRTWILRNAIVLTHDFCQGKDGRGKRFDTYIGKNCVIGVNSIILSGVTVGDHCVVAAGAVVAKSPPPTA